MDLFTKDCNNDTAESFSQRPPLGDRRNQNIPYMSHIQDLMSTLVTKKSELKEAKLRQGNLVGKSEQQEIRIHKTKIALDYEI